MKKTAVFLFIGLWMVNVPFAQTNWDQFGKYWYDGTAELTSYDLKQARYGEIHEGNAVLVFVTEPFSGTKQVKADRPGSDAVTVMKLNITKKFNTGIYPYSMMLSSFVPVSYDQHPKPLKVTGSIQEWCGQTFTQLNLTGSGFRYQSFSYFESEGDVSTTIKADWLEDAIWQRLRIDPTRAPVGSFTLQPGIFYERLAHKKPQPVSATAKLSTLEKSEFGAMAQWVYSLSHGDRSLVIYLEKSFPYAIVGWTETYGGLTTKATRMETVKNKYWELNKAKNLNERENLGLSTQTK